MHGPRSAMSYLEHFLKAHLYIFISRNHIKLSANPITKLKKYIFYRFKCLMENNFSMELPQNSHVKINMKHWIFSS